ncbi:PfkB family carbohydrate kinase [Gleimia coleocanis]|uniref:PfkB family carbohydrate kinase n=1 Tax=Gleimia coleocanis TaxID=103618 RepID=UPI00032009B6|nr:PfkB family carbohydrate kinase [Gleimia coleocanis]
MLADDPFSQIEEKPNYLRILDGGSWKPWLPTILPFIDVAVISADFKAPLATDVADTVEFLKGFGITKVVQTNGEESVRYWWDGVTGSVDVPSVKTVCTLGAGDIFHGAFAWGCAQLWNHTNELNAVQVVEVIRFATAIAAKSVQSFGTRTWLKSLGA